MRRCRAGGISACHSAADVIAGCVVRNAHVFCIGAVAAAASGSVEDFAVVVQLIVCSL